MQCSMLVQSLAAEYVLCVAAGWSTLCFKLSHLCVYLLFRVEKGRQTEQVNPYQQKRLSSVYMQELT